MAAPAFDLSHRSSRSPEADFVTALCDKLSSTLIRNTAPDRFSQKSDFFNREQLASSVLFQYKDGAKKSSQQESKSLKAIVLQGRL